MCGECRKRLDFGERDRDPRRVKEAPEALKETNNA